MSSNCKSFKHHVHKISFVEDGPGLYHEQIRRRIQNGVVELWYYISSEVNKIKTIATKKGYHDILTRTDEILDDGATQERWDIYCGNGHIFNGWNDIFFSNLSCI